MPKAAMNENGFLAPSEYNIGTAGQIFTVEPVAISERENRFANQQLRACIFGTDLRHEPRATLRRNDVHKVLLSLAVAEQGPLFGNVLIDGLPNDPPDGNFLLLGYSFKSLITLRWKTDCRPVFRRRLLALPLRLRFAIHYSS